MKRSGKSPPSPANRECVDIIRTASRPRLAAAATSRRRAKRDSGHVFELHLLRRGRFALRRTVTPHTGLNRREFLCCCIGGAFVRLIGFYEDGDAAGPPASAEPNRRSPEIQFAAL